MNAMTQYVYRAKRGPQEIVEGRVEAHSEAEALEKINALGLLPVRINAESAPLPEAKAPVVEMRVRGRVKPRQLTVFTRQLASLLKSGVPILTSLTIIAEQSDNPYLRHIIRTVHDRVKDGATFSASLAPFPQTFSALYIAMVRSGETGGQLPDALLRISEYRARQEEIFSRMRMALAYPVLMAVVGIATIVFMLTFVMPRLMNIFTTLGQELPLPTRLVISASELLRQWWFWMALALIILLGRWQSRLPSANHIMSRIRLHLPLAGKLIVKIELGRFCRTLELLLKGGIPILKAIEIAVPVVNNEILRDKLKDSYKVLEQGGSLGKSLKETRLFPAFMSNLIVVGEESGKLADALSEVATAYEHDADEAVKIMTNLLEPMMILAMGLIVGFIVIAMLLPVFEINAMAR